MKAQGSCIVCVLICFMCVQVSAAEHIQGTRSVGSVPTIVGLWQAMLAIPRGSLRIVVKFDRDHNEKISGLLDSPDQGLQGLPLENISFQDGTLIFDFLAGKAQFKGELSSNPDKIVGRWTQAGKVVELRFERISQAPEMVQKPQTPRPPFPYKTEDVTYVNRDAGLTLAGTMTIPPGAGPFPAAVLLTIAGPEDRDQSEGNHKHFLVLADYLSRHGIVVLRSDNRGVGASGGNYYNATTSDRAEDALAAFAFLQKRTEVYPKSIGFIGNSEGGEVGALAASRNIEVAFVVMLAAPALPGAELIRNQTESLAVIQDYSADQTREIMNREEAIFNILRTDLNQDSAFMKLQELAKGSTLD